VDALLGSLLETKIRESRRLGADVAAMVGAVRDLTMRGGKRLRPALLMAAYRAVAPGAPETAAIRAGAALELLQTYLLIHDDWMDRDGIRRGGPAVHVALARHHGSRRIGDAAAVLAGDYAAAVALETLARTDAPKKRVTESVALFAQIQQDVTRGQQIDLSARPRDVEAMYDLKSGSYTVRGPILLGATLAGAKRHTLLALTRFAGPLGVAFQLRDDLLGSFGDPDEIGKPAGGDIRSGKHTALVAEALVRASPADRRSVRETVERRHASEADVREITDVFERCGAREAVERRLGRLVRRARAALGEAGLSKSGSACLFGAASALTDRSR
jgi:geranylgeranyl diphosphate synthase, type I